MLQHTRTHRNSSIRIRIRIQREGLRSGDYRRVSSPPLLLHSLFNLRVQQIIEMKGSGTLLASVVAASTVALSSSTSHPNAAFFSSSYASASEGFSSTSGTNSAPNSHASSGKGKFAPRFDGLRFIETLVTAHR